jgi:malonate transporter and related proteins
MLDVFTITFPFFALVLCGYLAARRQFIRLEAIAGLNGFVLFFALPCMLFRFGASTPIVQLLDASVFLIYGVCALVMVAAALLWTKNQRIGWNDAAFGALVAAFPNTGFMGVPLLVALLGAQAAGPVIVTIVFDMVVTSSLCIALSRLGQGGQGAGQAAGTAARGALLGVVKNPMPWAILLGAWFSYAKLALWAPLNKTVGLLADAASPVALFTIGAVLARAQMLAHTSGQKPFLMRDVWPVVLLKLFAHPLLVAGVGLLAMKMGAPLSPLAFTVLILLAALPSASNVSLLAERLGANNGRIASIIMLTTALAFFTFSAAVQLLKP